MAEQLFRVQNFIETDASNLLSTIKDYKADGYRLVQACATNTVNNTEVLYSLDKDHELVQLRVTVPVECELESITEVFWGAFIYENEMHDLFGIKFKHSKLDFGGNFFITAGETPWKK